MNWEIGIDLYTLLCVNQVTNERLYRRELGSMFCGDLNGKEIQKRGYMQFTVPPKLSPHCKATILQ